MRFFKMDNSTKPLFEVVIDDLDEVLSQAVDQHEREEDFSNDGLDEILSQSLEEVKNSVEDAIDITDMFEFGGPSLVMARCVVGIVDTYMKRCPKDSLLNAFYLKPLQKFKKLKNCKNLKH